MKISASLSDLGMDSLMGAEIKQLLERNYDLTLSPQEIRNLTVEKLKAMADGPTDSDTITDTKNPQVCFFFLIFLYSNLIYNCFRLASMACN